jgi:hypothetical protein
MQRSCRGPDQTFIGANRTPEIDSVRPPSFRKLGGEVEIAGRGPVLTNATGYL